MTFWCLIKTNKCILISTAVACFEALILLQLLLNPFRSKPLCLYALLKPHAKMFKPRVYKPQFSRSTPIIFSQLKRRKHKLHVHTNDWLSSGLLKLLTGGVYIPGLFAWTKVEISTLLSIIWNMCSILSNLCTLSTICREEFQQSYSTCLTTECKQCMP